MPFEFGDLDLPTLQYFKEIDPSFEVKVDREEFEQRYRNVEDEKSIVEADVLVKHMNDTETDKPVCAKVIF